MSAPIGGKISEASSPVTAVIVVSNEEGFIPCVLFGHPLLSSTSSHPAALSARRRRATTRNNWFTMIKPCAPLFHAYKNPVHINMSKMRSCNRNSNTFSQYDSSNTKTNQV